MKTGNKKRVLACGGVQVLPEEVMTEVFLRLPIKSILRCRGVCRSWADALSSEEFCRLHMAKAEAASVPPKLFFTSPTSGFEATAVYLGSSSDPDDGLLFTLNGVRGDFLNMTSSPCHGLTLLYDAVAPAYYVFNAATRAVTRLPPCQDSAHATAGLTFDARAKEYKVVRLFHGKYLEKQHIKCEIYSLGGKQGDCWRPAVGGVPFRFCGAAWAAIILATSGKLQPVFADGFLNWLIHPGFLVKRPRAAILAFSITDESFRWIQSPPFVVSGVHLVELTDHLCMVRDLRYVSHNCSMLEIWKLNDYSSGGWSLKYRIDLLQHTARDLTEPKIIRVIGAVNTCGLTKKVVIATSNRKVIAYDPLLETLETILAIRETYSSYQTEESALRVSLFKESLVPVHQTNEEMALSTPLAQATREILLRLPGDYTVQSKLVCKQWLRLIENESFMHSYYAHNNMDRRPKIMLVGKGTGGSGFSFAPLNKLKRHTPNHDTWLDTKVVCSKPCHGMNLISTEMKDYLYNPYTGYRRVYLTREFTHMPCNNPGYGYMPQDHAFAVGNKNVGLGFNLLMQEHVIVKFFYHQKDFKSRQYLLTCTVNTCGIGSVQSHLYPPLPVSDMPPTYIEGLLYWMSEPRLGQTYKRAIVSFDIAANTFGVISCPSCIAMWNNASPSLAFVVELEGRLCAVLANPVVEELDIWKLENGEWGTAYKVNLKGWSGYSLRANVVLPLAVDPMDGKILLNTGKKLGTYDLTRHSIETLYDLDEMLHIRSTDQSSHFRVYEGVDVNNCKQHSVKKSCAWKPPAKQLKVFNASSPALSGKISASSSDPVAEELDIWKLEHNRWDRAFTLYLKGWPGYSLGANVVVPWAVDPKDGRILLNTGGKLGLYDPTRHFIKTLYDLDEVLRAKRERSSYTKFMLLVPMLCDESLTSYPHRRKARCLEYRMCVSGYPFRSFVVGQLISILVLLWRNKNLSAGILIGATLVWFLFNVVEYNVVTLLYHIALLGMLLLFIWSNAAPLFERRPPQIPEVIVSEQAFREIAQATHYKLAHFVSILYDIACGKDLKKFLMVHTICFFDLIRLSKLAHMLFSFLYYYKVIGSLWVLAIVGYTCSFTTLLYAGKYALHKRHEKRKTCSYVLIF
ncbi:hypothetical protein BAE44_0022732 [Dichanthelium oligosanthes]|uniref:Reticulon-like protein n=1 Tax=Dichanthelium oligosanthes TaxID=888268 RepID=A0A1E5UTL8_9POAL|nr:hypothetical protein BAE44_0022732 [Dichanthelium oligosanthes]